jgi:hypothetical protein
LCLKYILCLCPAPEVLNPCKCDTNGISCGGNDVINLKNIFNAIDQKLSENEKHFAQFYLNNTAITELEENTFYEITFDEIHIYNTTKLKLIHTNAFNATKSLTKILSVNYHYTESYDPNAIPLTNSPPTHDIFHMLSSITTLEEIHLCYTNITGIPSLAFKPINGAQNNLTFITFAYSSIVEIGDNAFSALENLSFLSFADNKIESIPKTAFNFENDSKEIMQLDLQSNKLNGESFPSDSFNNMKRPTFLYLGNNPNLKYLDQHIFQPFLESNIKNKIFIDEGGFKNGNFDCDDCRSYWLKKESKYNNRTDLWKCSNGKNYTDETNFAKCAHFF